MNPGVIARATAGDVSYAAIEKTNPSEVHAALSVNGDGPVVDVLLDMLLTLEDVGHGPGYASTA